MYEDTHAAPHCDQSILHAPGACPFCDGFPKRQADREMQRINFTGEHDPDKAPCPSTHFRSEELRDRWPGNRPEGYQQYDTFLERYIVTDQNFKDQAAARIERDLNTDVDIYYYEAPKTVDYSEKDAKFTQAMHNALYSPRKPTWWERVWDKIQAWLGA